MDVESSTSPKAFQPIPFESSDEQLPETLLEASIKNRETSIVLSVPLDVSPTRDAGREELVVRKSNGREWLCRSVGVVEELSVEALML